MKKVLASLLFLMLSVAAFGQYGTPIVQSQTYTATVSPAVVQALAAENSIFTIHNLFITTTGTAVGTVQLFGSSTGAAGSFTALSGTTTVSLAATTTYAIEGVTANYIAMNVSLSTCTTCVVQITYVAQINPIMATLQDGLWQAPLNACGWSSTTALGTPTTGTGDPGTKNVVAGQKVLYVNVASSAADVVTLDCDMSALSRTTTGKGLTITSVDVYYSVIYATVTLTANAPTINTVTYPASGGTAGGTVLTTAGGTLTTTPASIQKATSTTGVCYHLNVALGTPLAVNSPLVVPFYEMSFTASGGAAVQEYQLCGFAVNYTVQNL